MDDQVKILTDLGLSVTSISSQAELDVTKIRLYSIGEFRIPRRPRTSNCFCAKARLTQVTCHEKDKQTRENCG